jgi:putative flippase GtrA
MNLETSPERDERSHFGRRISTLTGRPVRYVLAGALNTLVGFSAYPALLWMSDWFREHYLLALLAVQVFCVCFAFTTYKIGVFRSKGSLLRDFVRFTSYYATIFGVNWAVLPFFVEVVGIDPIITQTVFNVFVVAFGYFWHSNVTFQDPKTEKSDSELPVHAQGRGEEAIGG